MTLLVIAIVAYLLYLAQYNDSDEEPWRFETLEDLRKEPGYDPWLYNDIEHPDYPSELDKRP
ncbi:hypothetical protein WJ969_02405 [Achromobacter xylosoxidans]